MTWSVVGQNVTIHCASNATFGIMVIESSNVTITGIQIIHCSAEFKQLQVYLILIESMYMLRHNVHPYFQQWLKNPASCDSDHVIVPCIATIVFCDNSNVSMQKITILHSRHIGLFSIKNSMMSIVSNLMAYNNINCIMILYHMNNMMDSEITESDETDGCIISDSRFLLGQAMNMSDSLASGLNLFLLVDTSASIGISIQSTYNTSACPYTAYFICE